MSEVKTNPETHGAKSAMSSDVSTTMSMRAQRAEEARARKKRFEAVKAKVYEFEKRNRSKLVAFKSTGGWWKMGGNSALIYYHRIAPRLGKKPKLKVDTDFYSKFRDGVVSIKDIEKFEEDLKTIKIFNSRSEAECRIFDLGYRISDEDMERIRRTEEDARQKINHIVAPKIVSPEIYVRLSEIVKIAYENVRKSEPVARDYIGLEVASVSKEILGEFMLAQNGKVSQVEGLTEVLKGVDVLMVRLVIMSELKLWSTTSCLRFGTILMELRTFVARELRRYKKEAAEAQVMAGDTMAIGDRMGREAEV